MKPLNLYFRLVLSLSALIGISGHKAEAADKPVTLKLGTLAPLGSSYHKSLLMMGEKWKTTSNGSLRLSVYAGGTQGSESDMVGLMQTGSLDAGLLTAIGVSEIEPGVSALQNMPMTFRSLEEVDYIGLQLREKLEKRLASKGYRVLFWTDSGWVRFFSTQPVVHPDDLKKMKIFCWAGDTKQFDLWKSAGFNPVSLETAGIPQGFLSGTINAIAMPPLFALATQVDGQAKHMLELNWAPLVGALVVREKSWERVPAALRQELLTAAADAGSHVKADGRAESEKAVQAMVKRGLMVQKATPELAEEWKRVVDTARDRIRGGLVPEDVYDEAQKLLAEYRAKGGGTPK